MTTDVCILHTTTGLSNSLTECTSSKHQHSLPPTCHFINITKWVCEIPSRTLSLLKYLREIKGMKETKAMMHAQKCPPSWFENRINQQFCRDVLICDNTLDNE